MIAHDTAESRRPEMSLLPREAVCYATGLLESSCFEEAKSLLRRMTPVSGRVLGHSHEHTLQMRWQYGEALYVDPAATLEDLREAVNTLEETERTARRVLGGAHPTTTGIVEDLLRAREVSNK